MVHHSRNHPLVNIALRGDMDRGLESEDLASTADWRDFPTFRKMYALKFLTPNLFAILRTAPEFTLSLKAMCQLSIKFGDAEHPSFHPFNAPPDRYCSARPAAR